MTTMTNGPCRLRRFTVRAVRWAGSPKVTQLPNPEGGVICDWVATVALLSVSPESSAKIEV